MVEKFGDAWVKKKITWVMVPISWRTTLLMKKSNLNVTRSTGTIKRLSLTVATFLAIENPRSTDVARYRAGDLDMTNYALPPEQFAKLQKNYLA